MNLIIDKEKAKNNFLTLYVALYLFASFIQLFLLSESKNTCTFFQLLGGLVVALFTLLKDNKITDKSNVKLILLICCYYILIQLVNFRSPFNVLYPLNALFLGFVVAKKPLNLKILYVELLIVSGMLFYFMINLYDPNTIFVNSSRNLISVVLLYTSLLIYFQEYKMDKPFSLLPAILTLVFSIWAVGRSGILCSLLLFVLVVCRYLKRSNLYYRFFFFFIFLLLFFLIMKLGVEVLDLFIRFEERGLSYEEDERSIMLNLYMSKLNLGTLFFGYNYFNDEQFSMWDFNVHNSFISFHALWGIGAIIFFFKFCRQFLLHFKKEKALMFLVLIFFLRAFSDAIAFNGMYDFVLVSMIFYSYSDGKYESLQNRLY